LPTGFPVTHKKLSQGGRNLEGKEQWQVAIPVRGPIPFGASSLLTGHDAAVVWVFIGVQPIGNAWVRSFRG
jgi:hypothetical protein